MKQPLNFRETADKIAVIADSEDKLLLSLCLYAGLRVGEAINVHREDFDGDHMRVRKTKVKGGADKYRYVKVTAPLRMVLDECMPERDGLLFYGRNHGGQLTSDGCNYRVKKYFGEDATVHSLRKTAALRIVEHLGDVNGILMAMKFLDHRSPETTMHYLGLTQEKVDAAVEGAFG